MDKNSILTSDLLNGIEKIRFAFTTRIGGASPEPYGMNVSYQVGDDPDLVTENRNRVFRRLGVRADAVAIPRQCHSAEVRVVTGGGTVEHTDGLMTRVPGVWLSVSVADCLPVFMVDPTQRAISAVHAGWRGSAGMIAEEAVSKMADEFGSDPKDLLVFIGPSAGRCCYEVGPEVAEQFGPEVVERRNGSLYLDLKKENLGQLRRAGVVGERVEVSPYCTVCNPALFHSYRREKERSGRMMGIIGMTG